jgi:hypothetical protein
MVTWDSFEPRRRVELGTETAERGEAHPTPSAAAHFIGLLARCAPPHLDGWPSGLRRTPGERVGNNLASWVRIPPRP